VPFVKISSAKLTDAELLKGAAQSGKPVILSTVPVKNEMTNIRRF